MTVLSALLPGIAALGQPTAQNGVWTPDQGTSKSSANNSLLPPATITSPTIPATVVPGAQPFLDPTTLPTVPGAADVGKEAAKIPAVPAKPFSEIRDPLVTHPGVDDSDVGKMTLPGDVQMVAPVFKPGSKAAIDQENLRAEQAKPKSNKPMKLYGRIEQLTATTGANFPVVFKAMTPQLDTTPGKKLTGKVGVDPTVFSGSIAKSFPNDFRGNWGGTLKVWTVQQMPVCYQIDPVEAGKIAKIFKAGSQGTVNFQFANDVRGGIYLAPAEVMFMASGADAGAADQMKQMMGGGQNMGAMGAMMAQMAQSMPVPVVFSFGDIQTGSMNKGLSGNDFVQRTIKNTTRQLAPNVLEQDVVAEMNEIMKSTGQPRKRYSESVLRFTKLNEQQMYVQAANVNFGPDRKFQDKIILYGTVNRGQVAQTNPYASIMNGMPGGQMPAGAGSIFGGSGAAGGAGQIPGMPDGMDILKKMFGQ